MSQSSKSGYRILVVEDESEIALILQAYLENAGMQVLCEPDGAQVGTRVQQFRPDLILLDINLPNQSGFDILTTLREQSFIPIIFVTARNTDHDRIAGLNLGGDDYIVKPFNPHDVIARINAVMRRVSAPEQKAIVRYAGIAIDCAECRAWVEGEVECELSLTPAEFAILSYLVSHPHRVISRTTMLEHCCPDSDALERTIDSHMSHLRKKLTESGLDNRIIQGVRGYGYRFG